MRWWSPDLDVILLECVWTC